MATAKKAVKSAKASKGSALVKWDEELAKYAVETASNERMPVGQKISVRGGVLQIGGAPIKDNRAKVIVLDSAYINAYYGGESFDPDNPKSPICFALNRVDEHMAPHKESHEPQHEACEGCGMNEFGSAEKGRGKACKNGRRIAVIAAQQLSEASIEDQEIFYLDIPVTSVKGWSYYVHGLANTMKRPTWAVVTELSVVPDPKTQFRVVFNVEEPISDGRFLQAIKTRRDGLKEDILFPFPKYQENAAPARGGRSASAPGRNKAASKAAAGKRR